MSRSLGHTRTALSYFVCVLQRKICMGLFHQVLACIHSDNRRTFFYLSKQKLYCFPGIFQDYTIDTNVKIQVLGVVALNQQC